MSQSDFDINDYIFDRATKGTPSTPADSYSNAFKMEFREMHHFSVIKGVVGSVAMQLSIEESRDGSAGWQTAWEDSAILITDFTHYITVVKSKTLSLPEFKYFRIKHAFTGGTEVTLDLYSIRLGWPRAPMNGYHIIGPGDPGTEGQGRVEKDANGNDRVRHNA